MDSNKKYKRLQNLETHYTVAFLVMQLAFMTTATMTIPFITIY